MNGFSLFAQLVAKSFQNIVIGDQVYVTEVEGDALWSKFLASFPEGTNPVHKKNTWHDCSCCRHFIKRIGNVVVVRDGIVRTVWDEAAKQKSLEHYADIAGLLRDAVRDAPIKDIFRVGHKEGAFGAKETHAFDKDLQKAIVWEHFYTGDIPLKFRSQQPDTDRGNYRTTIQVFERGLRELDPEAVSTVLSLIEGNSLYRGEEHKRAVVEFSKMQRAFLAKGELHRQTFLWESAASPAARFRNTVIGTLVQDLSDGVDLEHAVKSFETKVAPQNYKRTTALITPAMVKAALKTLQELDLEPALERRYATIRDVSVNDVLWVDGAVKPLMKGGIGDILLQHAAASVEVDVSKEEARAEKISIDDFMTRVLPQATRLEVFFKGAQAGNLMSVTAPVNPEPKQLFRWSNDFAWAYAGNIADGIKERVKRAGGNVVGTLRVSLSWWNYDDLDLHVKEPPARGSIGMFNEICFNNKRGWTGGTLDVDMNAGCGTTREPVENVIWPSTVPNGPYRVVVNNFAYRESSNPGFTVETECAGKVTHFSYNKIVRDKQDIHVCTLHMKGGAIERIEPGDPAVSSSAISQERWGLNTEKYVPVSSVMWSPNYWGTNAVGNKHTFFILQGAQNDEEARGFFNEFLHPRLEPHRKVFEVIADKTKCRPSDEQLSGLGFSSTKPDQILVRATIGRSTKIFNVTVGTGEK